MKTKQYTKQYLAFALLAIVVSVATFAYAQGTRKMATTKTVQWEVRYIDQAELANQGDATEFNKRVQHLLDEGWEPFAAGIYNGGAHYSTKYIYLRRVRTGK